MQTDSPTHSDAMLYVLHVRCSTRVGARSAFHRRVSDDGSRSSYRSPRTRRIAPRRPGRKAESRSAAGSVIVEVWYTELERPRPCHAVHACPCPSFPERSLPMWTSTPFTERFGCRYPIVQGPMGGGAS